MDILKLSTATTVNVFMADSVDHITGKTGLTLTAYLSKQGGTFNSITPVIMEKGFGWYQVSLTSSDTDTTGYLLLYVVAIGADPEAKEFHVSADAGLTPASFWDYSNRTLTYSPNNMMSISEDSLMFVRGDTLNYTFENVNLDGWSGSSVGDKAFFTVKKNYKDNDCDSIIQVDSASGLTVLNASSTNYSASATLNVNTSASSIELTIEAGITKLLPYFDEGFVYDLQTVISGSVVTPFIGTFDVIRDVTRKTN